jgi:hypothetical protein
MKTFFTLTAFFTIVQCSAQQTKPFSPTVAIKWAPTSLLLGSLGVQAEYSFSHKRSLTGKIGIPIKASHNFDYNGDKADFQMHAISFMAGMRNYFSAKKKMNGLYVEPYFKYVHHTAEGISNSTLNYQKVKWDFTNDYNAYGFGAQVGTQFLIRKRFMVDLFFIGPEINIATDNFKAVQISESLPWTSVEAEQAEQEISDFLNQFPFIRNHHHEVVDNNNKTVTANYKGAIPGIRTGFSLGYIF